MSGTIGRKNSRFICWKGFTNIR